MAAEVVVEGTEDSAMGIFAPDASKQIRPEGRCPRRRARASIGAIEGTFDAVLCPLLRCRARGSAASVDSPNRAYSHSLRTTEC